jgi:hypothetical protein
MHRRGIEPYFCCSNCSTFLYREDTFCINDEFLRKDIKMKIEMEKEHADALAGLLVIYGIDDIKSIIDTIYANHKRQSCKDFKGLRSLLEKDKK